MNIILKKIQLHIFFFSFLQQNMVSLISGLNEEAVLNNGNNNNSAGSQLKKGILWQQRDKIFSRWKERFFVLTNDYLQCFKKGSSRITEMGGFIYGLRLSEVILYDETTNTQCSIKIRVKKKCKIWRIFLSNSKWALSSDSCQLHFFHFLRVLCSV